MQKFTVFSILLSLSIVLGTVDVFFHGYLNPETTPTQESTEEETPPVEEVEPEIESEVDTEEDTPVDTVIDPTEETTEDLVDETVELQEETPSSLLTQDLFVQAGFGAPVLKSALFSGLVFQFIPMNSGTEVDGLQWNLFDGQNYVGTVYELLYSTDTGAFSSYLDLRDEAGKLTTLGNVNEVNLYGDASFYFNHSTKVKTVHIVIRYADRVFAFEYAQDAHDKMKKLFDILKTLE